MKRIVCFFWLCAAVMPVFWGCDKEDVEEGKDDPVIDVVLSTSERINKFLVEGVHTYYLWEAETDWKKYENRTTYAAYHDHDKLFNKLIYKDDKWSSLTDDIQGLENQFSGVSTTFGYTLSFYYNPFTANKNEVIAIVLFTSADSPAAKAGLKRGDIIVEMNGAKITTNNYQDLYYVASIQVRCAALDIENKSLTLLPKAYNLTAVEMYENPVITYKIIEKAGRKIGYLCYTGYQMESENELIRIFSGFKSAGVKEVVLDLRYNPGGFSRTALILSSVLAPESVIKNKRIYLEHHYNAMLTAYFKEQKIPLNENFVDTLSVNMDLNRLYVLTSKHTASASEATMVGLEPYLTLVQIGDTTSGKFCGGILLSPEDYYGEKKKSYYSGFKNWGMYIMIYRYANIKGVTSFTGGLVPQMQVKEDDFDLKPFGDETDPLLGRALADIQGIPYIERRSSAKHVFPFTPLPALKKPIDGLLIATPPVIPVAIEP